jgi:hypothetical protein
MKNSLSALATMEAASVEISGMDGLDKDGGAGGGPVYMTGTSSTESSKATHSCSPVVQGKGWHSSFRSERLGQ